MSKRIAKPVAPRLHFTKPHVESFRRCLRDNGYTESSIIERIRLLAGWADWMHAHGFGLDNVFIGLQAANNAFNSKKRSGDTPASGDYLCDICTREGVLAQPKPAQTPAERWAIIALFRQRARRHRGIADTPRST